MNKSTKVRWAGYLTALAGALAAGAHFSGVGPTWFAPACAAGAAFFASLGHILGEDPAPTDGAATKTA